MLIRTGTPGRHHTPSGIAFARLPSEGDYPGSNKSFRLFATVGVVTDYLCKNTQTKVTVRKQGLVWTTIRLLRSSSRSELL